MYLYIGRGFFVTKVNSPAIPHVGYLIKYFTHTPQYGLQSHKICVSYNPVLSEMAFESSIVGTTYI